MRLTDFIIALDNAGLYIVTAAQHSKIEMLHRKMFPVIAELESELSELSDENMEIMERHE